MWDIRECRVQSAVSGLLQHTSNRSPLSAVSLNLYSHQRRSNHSFYITTVKTETVSSSQTAIKWLSTRLRIKSNFLALAHQALHAPALLGMQVTFHVPKHAKLLAPPRGFCALCLYLKWSSSALSTGLYSCEPPPRLTFHFLRKAFPDHT